MDHDLRRRIVDDELKLRDGEACVQGQENRAQPPAGELHLQRIGRVHGQHRDPVAARHLEPVAQMRGETRNPRVELRVGEPAFAGEVDNRQFFRRPAAEMGNPVIVANRQNLLRRSSGLELPDPADLTLYLPDEGPYRNTSCVEWLADGLIGHPGSAAARSRAAASCSLHLV